MRFPWTTRRRPAARRSTRTWLPAALLRMCWSPACPSRAPESPDLKPVPATPNAVRWAFKMKKLSLVAPFKSPITVTLTYGAGIDRVGVIHDCAAKNASIVCREF